MFVSLAESQVTHTLRCAKRLEYRIDIFFSSIPMYSITFRAEAFTPELYTIHRSPTYKTLDRV